MGAHLVLMHYIFQLGDLSDKIDLEFDKYLPK